MLRKLLTALSGADENKNKKEAKKEAKKSRVFIINKVITTEGMADVISKITDIIVEDDKAEEKNPDFVREPIKLTIESYGGNIYDGLHLVNIMDTSRTPFHTYCYGKAMSMGLAIFSAGHVRFATKNTTFMYHDASNTIGGTIEQMQRSLDQCRRLTDILDSIITSTTNIEQEYLDHVKERIEDWYIFGNEAYEFGLVDKLIPSTRDLHRQK